MRGLLVLQGDGASFNEGLKGLSIFTLEHHLSCFQPSQEGSSSSVSMSRASTFGLYQEPLPEINSYV